MRIVNIEILKIDHLKILKHVLLLLKQLIK